MAGKTTNLPAGGSLVKTKPVELESTPSFPTMERLQAIAYRPGVTPGSVDVTGVVPEGVHVDPEITEGHAGYEESGNSELRIPT